MTQVPFEDHDSGVGMEFIPTEQTDFVPAVEQSNREFIQSIEKRNADLFQIEMSAAQKGGTGLEKLAKLAPSVMELPQVKGAIEARNTRRAVEEDQKAQKWLSENPDFFTQVYNPEELQDSTYQAGHEAIVDKAEATGELDVFTAREYRDIPGIHNKRFKQSILREASKQYGGFYLQSANTQIEIRDKNGETVKRSLNEATDPYERLQILQHINRAWMRPFSSAKGWDQAMVYKHLGVNMEKFSSARDAEFLNKTRQSYATLKVQRRYTSLGEALAFTDPAVGLQTYMQNNVGKFDGYGKDAMKMMRIQMVKDLDEMTKTEAYEDVARVRDAVINNQVKWNDGSVSSFAEKYPQDFATLDRKLAVYESEEYKEIKIKEQNKLGEIEAEFIQLVNAKRESTDPNEDKELTNSDIRGIYEQIQTELPGVAMPDFLSNYVTREERIDKADQELLTAIHRDKGVVTGNDTQGMSFATQKWAKDKFGNAFRAEGGDIGTQYLGLESGAHKRIDNIVNEHWQVTVGDTKDTEEIGEARRKAKLDFENLFWKHYNDPKNQGSASNAKELAIQEIKSNLVDGDYKISEINKPEENLHKKRNYVFEMAKSDPLGYQNKVFINSQNDIQQLVKIQNGVNVQIPNIYYYYARQNPKRNLDGWDVADAQLRAYEKENGLPVKGLAQPLTKQYVESLTSPLEKRFLKSRPSFGRTNRVIVMQDGGDFNRPDLVLEGAL
tara:strand:- start:866 stop:3040 length:2175 start_codon:yes stop_codon:yes gene_type:complete